MLTSCNVTFFVHAEHTEKQATRFGKVEGPGTGTQFSLSPGLLLLCPSVPPPLQVRTLDCSGNVGESPWCGGPACTCLQEDWAKVGTHPKGRRCGDPGQAHCPSWSLRGEGVCDTEMG